MNMDEEWDRLRRLYADNSDDELLALQARREDLTDLAQQALERVMNERGLRASAASDATGFGLTEEDIARRTDLASNEVCVVTFDDAFRANEAIRQLNKAGIECRIVDLSRAETNHTLALLNLGLVVHRADEKRAWEVLESEHGVFPPLQGGGVGEVLAPMDQVQVLAIFELPDALIAAQALGETGISFHWRDGRDEAEELPDEHTVAIEVRADRLEQATKVVEAKMASLPEAGG